ncbi:MAG: hypothetical protein ACO3TX_06790 [Pseudomonadales bacterium]
MTAVAVRVEGLDEFERKVRALAELPDMIVSGVNAALSDTVDDLYAREIQEFNLFFDRPTPWLRRGFIKMYPGGYDGGVRGNRRFGQTAMRAGLTVEEFPIRGSQADVLAPHIHGGPRSLKRNEKRLNNVVPLSSGKPWIMGRNFPKNQYGNIAGHWYSKALHEIGAANEVMPGGRNSTRSAALASRSKKGRGFFVPRNKPWLLMERTGKKSVRVFLVRSQGGTNYTNKFRYYEVGRQQVQYSLPLHFNRNIERLLKRID